MKFLGGLDSVTGVVYPKNLARRSVQAQPQAFPRKSGGIVPCVAVWGNAQS